MVAEVQGAADQGARAAAAVAAEAHALVLWAVRRVVAAMGWEVLVAVMMAAAETEAARAAEAAAVAAALVEAGQAATLAAVAVSVGRHAVRVAAPAA
eukprot:1479794-Prymnesium_polylepis.1